MRSIKNVTSSWNWPNLSASNCCTCPPTRPTSISSNACGNSSRRIVCTRPITTTLRSSNRPSHPVSLKLKPHTGPPSTPCFPTASRPSKNQKLCHGRVYIRGELAATRAHAAAFLADVEARPESPEAGVAHRILGSTHWYAGEYREARSHLEQALALFKPGRDDDLALRFGHDVGVAAMLYLGLVLW